MSRVPGPGPAALREAAGRAAPQPRLILLRHGDPAWTAADGLSINDPGLTVYGQRQAEAAATRLAEEGVDAIYVSPLCRCQETAIPIAEQTGIEPVTIDGLAEIAVALGGLSQEDVDRYFVEAAQRPLEEHWAGWPGAEPFMDFHARITVSIADILGRHGIRERRSDDFKLWDLGEESPTILIVAHGGSNAVALTHLLDIRPVPWEWIRFESELASFSVSGARPMGPHGHVWSLQNFNEVDHLSGLQG